MALPIINSLTCCCSYKKTVTPYLPQLYKLPTNILQLWKSPDELKKLYLSTNPFITALAFSLFLAFLFFVSSVINRNNSQVDRFWSILPSVYNLHFVLFAKLSSLQTTRLKIMFVVGVLWMLIKVREIIRKAMNPIQFLIFNIIFVSLAQSVLLFLITTPSYIILLVAQVSPKNSTADCVFASVLIALIAIEFISDQQQWSTLKLLNPNFQEAKRNYNENSELLHGYQKEDLDRGFLAQGLWSLSRHPNFAAEQAIWIVFYLHGCWTTKTLFNWTSCGFISYLLLFQGSTVLTEKISAGKYCEYVEYQKKVGKFIPKIYIKPFGDSPRKRKAENKSL
ncbi:Uncharacterized protein GcM3_010004 [Golovinomyces cichoracearum]|uniref:Steroid 5-alpha reductase C-terminal domain-containing protein n=1 Tax=Golovinomyces cichoracearum TaxID=62708 RepID=A0A420JA39_9PEZI|nr:Uncharacterized protein GcM3_010004 [Golovinomyces cichoracearum]